MARYTEVLLREGEGGATNAASSPQDRLTSLGLAIWIAGYLLQATNNFATDYGGSHQVLYGYLSLLVALLQTAGALAVAASDVDKDFYAQRHPITVRAFALAFVLSYEGVQALGNGLPIQFLWSNQVYWIGALPFVYFLARRQESLFSTLFACSLVCDLLR